MNDSCLTFLFYNYIRINFRHLKKVTVEDAENFAQYPDLLI